MPENEQQATVSYFVYERSMERMYRIIRILATILIAALVIFVVNNVIWMRYVDKQVESAKAEVYIEETADPTIYQQSSESID